MNVPYVDLAEQHVPIKEKLLEAVSKVLDHGKFVLGEEVAEFEQRFAQLCGVQYAVALNSGTDALILALKTVGV
ncbi:MAG: DegT/DnrJ/EryC1/StrS family aminotransferase, partial [Deltaproteobacteria bacterium]